MTELLGLHLTKDEQEKLTRLAKARNLSANDCIRDFIRHAQPSGSGWLSPELRGKK